MLRLLTVFLLSFFLFPVIVFGQKVNKYNLKIIENLDYYKQMLIEDPNLELVELKSLIPDIVYDLRYAGRNNFTGKKLYPSDTRLTFLRKLPAEALKAAADEFKTMGYKIKVFDAYRPYSVTEKFWKLIKDERYVAHPRSGSGHNRGLAIDLTLIDIKTGNEIEMGTGYDDFNETAHHGAENISNTAKANREILKNVMLRHGFRLFETEWWHYSWPNTDNRYDVMNIPFKKLN